MNYINKVLHNPLLQRPDFLCRNHHYKQHLNMKMHGWRKTIPSNHFQMKMIIYNNESQKKSLPTSSNKEQRTEPNTTEHILPIFT